MKTNFKILDQTDPEFINNKLDESALSEISRRLKKRRLQPIHPGKDKSASSLIGKKVKN